ncbi:hypothetical protein N752_21105 [Desulforamulus aquiferis]|nr:hypothetical protein N752_21105 [Desulforamulus aquiferis]
MKTKRILLIALFISLAAVLSIVERSIIIPPHPV